MKIIRAVSAGFCFGVERAYRLVTETHGDDVQIVGELIHNPQVVAELATRGIRTVASIDDLTPGTAIVRAHGISDAAKTAIKKRAGTMIDASCPFVIRLHAAAGDFVRRGLPTIIVGRPDHPEMRGVVEDYPTVIVTTDIDDARLRPLAGQTVGVLVQTTETAASFDRFVDALKKMGCTVETVNTICSATTDRQTAVIALADEVDAIVVIGGRNSNNTKNLFELAAIRRPSVWIETEDELDAAFFTGKKTVGVTAGASTPESRITAVINRLESF